MAPWCSVILYCNTNIFIFVKKEFITKCVRYYKVRQLLQSMTDCYYKVRQLLQYTTVITKWDVTKGGVSETFFIDLSKAFACIFCEPLITKLATYGFDYSPLLLIYSYLSNRKQKTEMNILCSTKSDVVFGVTQSS